MTDHYEDAEDARRRTLSNGQVLRFITGFWLRRPWLLAGTIGLTLTAIGFDLALPWAAGRLVDAVGAGPAEPAPTGRGRQECLQRPRAPLRR